MKPSDRTIFLTAALALKKLGGSMEFETLDCLELSLAMDRGDVRIEHERLPDGTVAATLRVKGPVVDVTSLAIEIVKCPQCQHPFRSHDTFWWGADGDGDPTVENISCPKCGASTRPTDKRRRAWRFDDFAVQVTSLTGPAASPGSP